MLCTNQAKGWLTIVVPISPQYYTYPKVAGASPWPIAQAMLIDGLPTYFLNPILYSPGICESKKSNIFHITDPRIASLNLISIASQASRTRLTFSFYSPSLSTFLKTSFKLFLET